MRFLPKLLGILALALLITGPGSAAVPGLPEKAPAESAKPAENSSPAKIKIVPHRAIYDMSLGSVKNGSNITGVSGRMLFEWGDVCDGWTVQQHLKLHFNYAEGDESDVTSTELTWEAKDGKNYNFNIHRVSDGKETEAYRGKAFLGEDGSGTATYTLPAGKTVKLPAGTVFPSTHTVMILQKAEAGDKLFSRRVFDGSDEDGSNDVSVFISPASGHIQDAQLNSKLKSNALLAPPSWPVRMAFFKIKTETGQPDYEMNLDLLSNGIARKMQIDYGDFSVIGVLSDVEALPASGC